MCEWCGVCVSVMMGDGDRGECGEWDDGEEDEEVGGW